MFVLGSVVVYLIGAMVAVSAITVIMLLTQMNNNKESKHLKYMMLFLVANLLLGALYLWETIVEADYQVYNYNMLVRVLDISLFILQGFSWSKYLMCHAGSAGALLKRLCVPVFAVTFLFGVIAYGFLMDRSFDPVNVWAPVLEVAIAVLLTGYESSCIVMILRREYPKPFKGYVGCSGAVMVFNGIWNAIYTLSIMSKDGAFMDIADLTPLCLAVITVMALIYIYRKDFKTAAAQREHLPEKDVETLVKDAAEKYGLSEREKDVLALAYEGFSNPEIADELYISKNTVKRHMHSIFEKMEVSTRIEMVHRVKEDE